MVRRREREREKKQQEREGVGGVKLLKMNHEKNIQVYAYTDVWLTCSIFQLLDGARLGRGLHRTAEEQRPQQEQNW